MQSIDLRVPLFLASMLCWALASNSRASDAKGPPSSTPVLKAEVVILRDLEDRPVAPFQASNTAALVFLFVRTDCPISNRYAPEIRRLAAKYAKQGAAFWLVYPDATESVPEIRKHLRDYQLSLSALRDPNHVLAKLAKARVTPEVAVFLPNGTQVYGGRIDDRFVDFGKERPEATEHDLERALVRVLNHQPVATRSTRAIGCYIGD